MLLLGIETTCDETAAAVVEDGLRVRSSIVASQVASHAPFGGVVPEIASRRHVANLTGVIEAAMKAAGGLRFEDLHGVAVARSPGLIGALMIGVTAARTIAWACGKPLVAVNHIEAHLHANALAAGAPLPDSYVALIVSGGHTNLYLREEGRTRCLGKTRDDAAGESFDKVAAILGLGYPGGPEIERVAKAGDPKAVPVPRAWLEPGSFDFSFSGLKTAALYAFKGQPNRARPQGTHRMEDVAASFQEAVVDVLARKTIRAAREAGVHLVLLGGGVACNGRLRERLRAEGERRGIEVRWPPPRLCTDNAAMIAGLACERLARGEVSSLDTVSSPANEFE